MFTLEISLMGLGLGIDAAVATFALGLIGLELPIHHKWSRAISISLIFGFFQSLMLWLGSLGGYFFTFSALGYLFHIIVALIFLVLGVKLFQDSQHQEKKEMVWGIGHILLIALATSIDALAAGVSFGTLPNSHLAASAIGVITFVLCGLFYLLSQIFQELPHKWLLKFAGFFFFVLASKILWDFFFKGVL